ncbi:MAG: hypothetical protein WAM62_04155 [Pseudolabrys sp.]
MRAGLIQGLGLLLCAVTVAPGAAQAQDQVQAQDSAAAAYASTSPSNDPADQPAAPAQSELSPEDSALLDQALTPNPTTSDSTAAVKPLRLPSRTFQQGLNIKTVQKPDGSSAVTLNQPLQTEWDAKVGADLGLAASAPQNYQPGQPLPGVRDNRSTGAAWASVGLLPNLATVDARVDPGNDQGTLGTTFKHSVPLGGKFAVTLQDSYSVTETFSASTAASSDMPLMAAPVAPAVPMPQVWGSEKTAKFDILPTGTSFGAKLASISNDPVLHNTLSAEQKIYGALHVTTAMNDLGQPTASRSITAGFKLNW